MTENPYLVGLRLAGKKVVVVGGAWLAVLLAVSV
ncbi:hypothetical protein, partial [Mycobacterium tuberculosis]